MSFRVEQPRSRGRNQDKVAQFYYSHGLFCSTYPTFVISLAIIIALICCYPLINLPLPGNAPLRQWTSRSNLSVQPYCYIQHVILKSAVLPWDNDLKLGDAFRAPLYEAFKLLEIVRNYEDANSGKTLGHVCLHVEAINRNKAITENVLPQYTCLVLSPANLWQQDLQRFATDNSLLTTIFNHHSFQKGKSSITEMLFGMHLHETGIKRYPLRNRQRIIQYAITLFFKEYDTGFINDLKHKLITLYPLHSQNWTSSSSSSDDNNDKILLIQYPGEINFIEFIPLTIAFVLLFLYYYFSVRKIEIIKSKFGMAFTTVITVFGSLMMTLGICFFFGLTLNLEGKGVFPFLILLLGLENVLVLTKSVVSTPSHLDVKIRIAQGLSKEGWSITKNFFLEITILTFGLFTFVPAIQEFCIFAIVGLITDSFLQMFFFSTILGVDIRRMENLVQKNTSSILRNSVFQTLNYDKTLNRSKSHPGLSNFSMMTGAHQNGNHHHHHNDKKVPKRLRLVNIWARTRFFQRAFMILMVTWIINIAYNSGIIEHYILNSNNNNNNTEGENLNYSSIKLFPLLNTNDSIIKNVNYVTHNPIDLKYQRQNQTFEIEKLKHSDYSPWLKLSPQHWLTILRTYNLSISGQYIAILEDIKLSHIIRPDQAILLRNRDEKYGEKFQWHALAAALDSTIDFDTELASSSLLASSSSSSSSSSSPSSSSTSSSSQGAEQPFYPTSIFAIVLTTILCLISIIVLSYIFVVLYRCICSRNYAEWRASWFNNNERSDESGSEEQVLLEAVPIVLDGHQQEIESIATDGASLVSCCLDGQLKVWDTSTGELLTNINRKAYFSTTNKFENFNGTKGVNQNNDDDDYDDNDNDNNSSDYESGSPPSRETWLFPKIKHRINTDFSNIKDTMFKIGTSSGTSIYDAKRSFNKTYRELYFKSDSAETKTWRNFKISKQNGKKSCDEVASDVQVQKLSPIWCMDYTDNLIVIGCADGRLEFWDGTTGKLKCIFEDGNEVGVNSVKIIGSKVIASRLYGTLDLYQLQTYNHGRPIDWNFTCAYRRTHIRTGSMGSSIQELVNETSRQDNEDDLQCLKLITIKSHQQPITCLDCEGGRIITGSQDHTLKGYRLEDGSALYTLHGHCGPITALFIDRVNPATAGSGSQDGMLCVWDLFTGTCMYNTQAHDGSVISLTYSASYIISLGSDDRLCVWERFQGHLLNTIMHLSQNFSTQILMLTPHLVVTSRNGGLSIWDVRSGDCIRAIALGRSPFILIKQIILLRDAVLCDYGNQLRIVRFPLITHKFD